MKRVLKISPISGVKADIIIEYIVRDDNGDMIRT